MLEKRELREARHEVDEQVEVALRQEAEDELGAVDLVLTGSSRVDTRGQEEPTDVLVDEWCGQGGEEVLEQGGRVMDGFEGEVVVRAELGCLLVHRLELFAPTRITGGDQKQLDCRAWRSGDSQDACARNN